MARVLILGGTAWLGREIAREWVARGAEVVCLARGRSGDIPDGARLVTADRTTPEAFDELDGTWDEVVELAYEPDVVAPALDALADRAAHWTLVSSISVYADFTIRDEAAPVVEPSDLTQYPDAKVAAERATAAALGGRLLIARPGLIAGPGDPSDRFGYWPARLARGGTVLRPRGEGRFVQVIDVADLAAWIAHAGSTGVTGVVDAVGKVNRFDDVLALAADVTGFAGSWRVAGDGELAAGGIGHWAGPASLPLWLPEDAAPMAQRDNARFRAAGGSLRPLRETMVRTLEDEVGRGLDRERRSGLSLAEEAAALERLRRDAG
nr:NAD-dependent epimerase/dehydratase family protein [Actinomycetales bacterium]